ncbi:MAG: excinuclease ABC subunit UvrC [Nitrospirae bacterium]|nr:excinuclease ABC subunit UvrC [Nitrospirota bacterium]
MTLEEKIKNLPDRPGVYLMKGARGRVIYVGKAKSLRNRVRSYFQKGAETDPRRASMVEHILDFETVITGSEMEAFILESTLIKKHKPRYNVVLRDDKNYPYLKLTLGDKFPTLSVVRRMDKDGALYFGPYVPTGPMWETFKLINRTFPMRKCRKKDIGEKPGRPCLQFGMKRCLGPCSGAVERDEYMKTVDEVRLFLTGKDRELVRDLEARMESASEAMNFEAAAHIRDRLYALKRATETQRVISTDLSDRDIIAVVKEGAAADIQILFVRQGKLLGRKDFFFTDSLESAEYELLTDFINQFYTEEREVPPEVLVSHTLPERPLLEEFLSARRGKTTVLAVPERGPKAKLMEMAVDNARVALGQNLTTAAGRELTLMALKSELGLKKLPRRVECFDISNTGGQEAVGSLVAFEDGVAKKSGYRHYTIKTVDGANDFAMMEEVIYRRYRRVMDEDEPWPDLIMVDGGKGQLNAALEALKDLGADLAALDVVGLAKAREKGLKYGGIGEKRAYERVYKPGEEDARILSPTSAAVNLLAQVRDESHRFAITHHRKLRQKRGAASPLDGIPGIGAKRKLALLKHFGSFRAIREATLEELKAAPGLPGKVAEEIFGRLHGGAASQSV